MNLDSCSVPGRATHIPVQPNRKSMKTPNPIVPNMSAALHLASGKAARCARNGFCSLAIAAGFAPGVAPAATTGFNQSTAGPWDYNDAANWASSTINGIWNTDLTLGAAQTVQFAADTVLTTGLTFNYAGNFPLVLDASAAGTKNLTLAGDIGLNTGGGVLANVTLGDAANHLNVNLGAATRTMTVAIGRSLTFVDAVSNGGIAKAGDGILTLSGSNTYSLGTSVTAGALSFLNTTAQPSSGTTTVAAAATLGLGVSGAGAFTSANVDALFASPATLPNVTLTDGANVGIDTSAGDFTYASNTPANNRGLAKLGANKLTLTGTHAYTGDTIVRLGTLEMTGGSITSAGNFYGAVNNDQPTTRMSGSATVKLTDATKKAMIGGNIMEGSSLYPATMVMSGTASFTTAGSFSVGGWPGGAFGSGEFAMKDSATLTVESTASVGFYVQGDGARGTSHMLLADSAKVNCNRLTVSSNFGTLTQTGAGTEVNCTYSAAAGQYIRIANGGGRQGWYNMTAGKFNVNANPGGPGFIVIVGANRGFGHWNITGTAEVNIPADAEFRLAGNQTGTLGYFGEVNLVGGTLSVPKVTSPDIGGDVKGGVFNFNGGTLKAIKDATDFMQNLMAVNNATGGAAWVHAGGAIIDTNTFNITIAEPLLEPFGQGVTGVSFNPGTQTYAAPPRVYFQEPSATLSLPAIAQGFATLDASGHINGIVMTNPGLGYSTTPTVSFDRGDATATCTLGAIGGGGLTKNGAGTLTLSGANTYTGDTVVNTGTLVLADAAGGLKFKIGANGVNNKIRGTGSVILGGIFTLDLSGAAAVVGNSWTLVDVTNLTESYTSSFSIAGTGWAESANVWTKTDDVDPGKIWKYTEATGVLALLPAAAEIAVEESSVDVPNNSTKDFGSVLVGADLTLTFTIKNTGVGDLTDLTISKSGDHLADFTVTQVNPVAPVASAGSTTFTVTFAPVGSGVRSAAIEIANNDPDESPFTIHLSGTGTTPFSIWALTNITARDEHAAAGPMDDPDGDGSNNLSEFAFAGDPLSGSDQAKVHSWVADPRASGNELVLTVAVRSDAPDFMLDGNLLSMSATSASGGITYTMEGSDNLVFPGSAVTEIGDQSTEAMRALLPEGYGYRSFVLLDGGLAGKGFLRAKVLK